MGPCMHADWGIWGWFRETIPCKAISMEQTRVQEQVGKGMCIIFLYSTSIGSDSRILRSRIVSLTIFGVHKHGILVKYGTNG